MKRFANICFFLILTICLVGGGFLCHAQIKENRSLKHELHRLIETNEDLQREINEQRKRRLAFEKDPDYVELVALKEGRARASEVIYQFDPGEKRPERESAEQNNR